MENEAIRALVVGNGAREHAYISKMRQSPRLEDVFVTVGNAGINQIAKPVDFWPDDISRIVQFVADERINLVISGGELFYALEGIDQLQREFGGRTDLKRYFFGPTHEAAQIESSKIWGADFNTQYGIPQPNHIYGDTADDVKEKLLKTGWSGFAVKADELDHGHGVVVCNSLAEANLAVDNFMVKRIHGQRVGNWVLVQEKLEGQELTVMAWVDKDGNYAIMPFSRDNKALNGKNTGGVAATAPMSAETPSQADEIHEILRKGINGMIEEGYPFVGILYAGLMLTEDGIKVLEWNCRGGDPEIESVLPLYSEKFDIISAMIKCVEGGVKQKDFWWRYAVANTTVVLATPGYPDDPKTGQVIHGLEKEYNKRIQIYHGATDLRSGQVVTTGGRAIVISATADLQRESSQLAYSVIGEDGIHFEGMQYLVGIGLG